MLPYDTVRAGADPDGLVLAFYEAASRAGTTAAGWDLSAAAPHTPAA